MATTGPRLHERNGGTLPRRIVSVSIPDPLLAELERARGDEPRSVFIQRAVAAELARLQSAAAQGASR